MSCPDDTPPCAHCRRPLSARHELGSELAGFCFFCLAAQLQEMGFYGVTLRLRPIVSEPAAKEGN